jgi:uncharacterized membrane protein YphA (DoxX/SURF4 family)
MENLKILGRVFFGLGILGIGVLHFFFPGIRPIIIPGLADGSPAMNILGWLIGTVLIVTGVLISIGYKHSTLALLMGIAFLILGVFVHLPAFVNSGRPFWVNLNKVFALSGGFFLVSALHPSRPDSRILISLSKVTVVGKYLFAIMLFTFGTGHLLASAALSQLVPEYIPFRQFWAFLGGIALTGSAISIVSNIWVKKVTILLGAVLFIWLISLHSYYAILFPNWEEGENFIGVFTCLAFCGTALLISQQGKTK